MSPNIPSRVIYIASFGLFLAACAYVGYLNGKLKASVGDLDRAVLSIGFIFGAGAISRYLRIAAFGRYLEFRDRRRRARAGAG